MGPTFFMSKLAASDSAVPQPAGAVRLGRPRIGQLSSANLHRLALVAILAFGLVVRLSGINTDELRLDEPQSLKTARLSVPDLVVEAANEDTHPPLYYLALHYWLQVFGESPAALRSLSLVFGLGAIVTLFALGRALAGPRAGLLASLLLALSAFHAEYSQEARNYSLLAFSALLSFLFFVKVLERPTTWLTLGYVAATTALLYTHVYGLFVVLAQVALVVLRAMIERRSTDLRRWGLSLGAVGLLFLPWLVVLVRQTGEEVEGGSDANLDWLPEPALRWLPGTLARYAGSVWALAVVGVVLAIAAALSLRTDRLRLRDLGRDQRVLLPAVWLVCSTVVPFVLSFLVVPMYQVKYTIAAAPAFYLLVGIALAGLPSRALRATAAAAVLASAAVATWSWHTGDRAYWRGLEPPPASASSSRAGEPAALERRI